MECQDLQKRDEEEPILRFSGVDSRCQRLAMKISEVLGEPAGVIYLDPATVSDETTISLGSQSGEVIQRNAGQRHRVIQLCSLSGEIFAWVGFR